MLSSAFRLSLVFSFSSSRQSSEARTRLSILRHLELDSVDVIAVAPFKVVVDVCVPVVALGVRVHEHLHVCEVPEGRHLAVSGHLQALGKGYVSWMVTEAIALLVVSTVYCRLAV